jgi:flagellar biosynthetic protein FliR
MAVAPVFSRTDIPRRMKMMVAVVLAGSMLPYASQDAVLPTDGFAYAGALLGEFSVGFGIGLLARLLMTAFQLAGTIMSFQMGFAMARAFDPDSATQTPIIATVHVMMVTLIFLLLDGHHFLVRSVAASYEAFPLGKGLGDILMTETVLAASGNMFEMGARVAAPVTGLMLLIKAALGFLNRVSPAFSIFSIGFPITVMSGLVIVIFSLPEAAQFFLHAYADLHSDISILLRP